MNLGRRPSARKMREARDRFRALPMSGAAVVLGRCLADMLNSVVALAIMIVTGLVLGWHYVKRLVQKGEVKSARDNAVEVQGQLMDEHIWTLKGSIDFVDNQYDRSSGTIRATLIAVSTASAPVFIGSTMSLPQSSASPRQNVANWSCTNARLVRVSRSESIRARYRRSSARDRRARPPVARRLTGSRGVA